MPNLNERAHELANQMAADADALGIAVSTLDCGTRIIDCGVKAPGSVEAGRRLAEVCMAGLGTVIFVPNEGIRRDAQNWLDLTPLYRGVDTGFIWVHTDQPVAACMASQYAGWQIKGESYFAMGSGPMRAAAETGNTFRRDRATRAPDICVGVLESSKVPPESVCVDIAAKCGLKPERLTLLIARTSSLAGTVQIVARSVETALHKLHELDFDLLQVKRGYGFAPLPPIASDDLAAIGWTNDAILYGGNVGLEVIASTREIEEVGPHVPSNASPDYGEPFGEIFKRYDRDFYRIDPMLFSPARIGFTIADRKELGETVFGTLAPEILIRSFAKK